VDEQQALLGRDAEPEREAVVAGAAVDVEAVGAPRPQPVIGDAAEDGDDRVGEAEAEQAELAAVGVSREHQIGGSCGQVPEGAGIVEHGDPGEAGGAGEGLGDRGEVAVALPEAEVDAEDLDRAGLGLDDDELVDEQRGADAGEAVGDVPGGLVIVVAPSGARARASTSGSA
jgi:hypothetical protein